MRECEEIQVVCIQEESCDKISRLTCDWQVTKVPHVWSMQEVKGSRQLEHYRTKSIAWLAVNSWLKLATHSSREAESLECLVLLKTDFSHSILYPTINTLIPMKCRKLLERILRGNPKEQQDWFIILMHLILQIPLLSASPFSYPWEDLKPNPYHTMPISMRSNLVLGKQFKDD